jgi:hypothetical protein
MASLLCVHWRTATFPGNVPVVVPRLRAVVRVELHRDRKCRPYWNEQDSVRSGLVNIPQTPGSLWVLSGSFGRLSLSARNNRWLLVAEISPWMRYQVFYAYVYSRDGMRLRECRSDEDVRGPLDLLRMDYLQISLQCAIVCQRQGMGPFSLLFGHLVRPTGSLTSLLTISPLDFLWSAGRNFSHPRWKSRELEQLFGGGPLPRQEKSFESEMISFSKCRMRATIRTISPPTMRRTIVKNPMPSWFPPRWDMIRNLARRFRRWHCRPQFKSSIKVFLFGDSSSPLQKLGSMRLEYSSQRCVDPRSCRRPLNYEIKTDISWPKSKQFIPFSSDLLTMPVGHFPIQHSSCIQVQPLKSEESILFPWMISLVLIRIILHYDQQANWWQTLKEFISYSCMKDYSVRIGVQYLGKQQVILRVTSFRNSLLIEFLFRSLVRLHRWELVDRILVNMLLLHKFGRLHDTTDFLASWWELLFLWKVEFVTRGITMWHHLSNDCKSAFRNRAADRNDERPIGFSKNPSENEVISISLFFLASWWGKIAYHSVIWKGSPRT